MVEILLLAILFVLLVVFIPGFFEWFFAILFGLVALAALGLGIALIDWQSFVAGVAREFAGFEKLLAFIALLWVIDWVVRRTPPVEKRNKK
jgi:hypothetical protein